MTITRSIILSLLVIGCLCNTSCISKKLTANRSAINTVKDTDGDGVNDADDQCPDIKGLASLAGCPDMDGDGIADNKDKCPEMVGSLRYQGCPVPDSDKDGLNDEADECPTVFGYARYKGCLIPDTDGDGVNDEEDKCINEAGAVSNNGCPMTEENKTAAIVDKVEDTLYPVVDKEKQLSKKQSQKRTAVKRISPKPASILANKSSYSNINSTITTISRDTVLSAATILLTYHAGIKANTENITLHLIPRKPGADTAKQNGELFNNGLVFTRLNDSTASCMVPNIQAFQQLKASTSYNQSAINLIPTNAEEQNLDIEKGNNWQWAIKPKTDNADSVTITIAVIGKKAVGAAITIASSQFKVKADVNKTDPPDTNTGQWPGKYAGYLLSCVVAVIGLFVLIVRKKKKDTAGENANGPKT